MKNYEEYISGLKLPVYILIRNLRFEHDFDYDSPISRGEIVSHSENFHELKKQIPLPVIPAEDYKLTLLETKYAGIPFNEIEFDDSVYDATEGDPNDYEIFGESFSIILFSPPDENRMVEFLLERYQEAHALVRIWSEYIDRIHLFPFFSLESTSEDFYNSICDRFEQEIMNLPDPPSEEEWDELNEYL